ncbi:lysylphosphatidylglycerol synthase transmembrane domain-containing protein [Candidatus Chlorohelix sp.]|uniref:lysylphosphatidylglycerol synthase transmembrane domain-containing protein n=1 Tax=Candidatus Chlorohelix sp. TaxID=3139201 RepID=UPI00306E6DFA
MGLFQKDKLKFWFGLLVGAIFLYLTFRGQELDKIGDALGKANYWWLIPALLVYFLGVFVRAIRWHFLLKPLQTIPISRLYPVVVVGYMANNVLPVRMGEVVRAYILDRREHLSKTRSLATIVVERIMDGITMLLFIAIASFSVSLTGDIAGVERVAGVVFLVGIVVFLFLASNRRLLLAVERFALKLLPGKIRPKLEGLADRFIDGLQVLRQWRDLLAVFALSVLAWACEGAMYWFVALTFSELSLSFTAIILTLAVANLFTLVPSTPGYFGPFDFAAKQVLVGIFLIPANLAASYVILLHAALYFPVTLLGLYYWLKEHLSLKEAENERKLIENEKKHFSHQDLLQPETIEVTPTRNK